MWDRLAGVFRPGDRVLELGCGTGEDAVWLARQGVEVWATDSSPAMIEVARAKAQAVGLDYLVHCGVLDMAALGPDSMPRDAAFDGALSSFGAVNCLPSLRPLVQTLANWIRPGGYLALVAMGPYCPWEAIWHLGHGESGTAFRRLRAGATANLGANARAAVWYPSPRCLRAELKPFFRHRRTVGVGVFLPPTYLSHLVDRWHGLSANLLRLDRRLGGTFPWTWLNNHYLLLCQRR